jgi:hypothetical protein
MYIKRFLEKKVMNYLDRKEIIAIVGARQCGKTTLIKHIYDQLENTEFISFEDREVLELFSQDIKGFVELYVKDNKYLFIDEFQYAKKGGKQLKYIYDTFDIKIIISGSSAPDLSIQSIKYLVGRIFVLNLYPLSFEEFLSFKDDKLFKLYFNGKLSKPIIDNINQFYNEFVIYGGYPSVVLAEDKEAKIEVLRNIYNTYFLKEIKEILQLTEDFKLSKLIKVLALQLGGIVNYHELSQSIGFNYKELLNQLNILKKTFICIESNPFFTNKKKEITKSPKLFFLDNGFRNMVIKNFQNLKDRSDIGALNENFIASELIKQEIELKYWRTKAKAEVDFIVEQEGDIFPLEVKSNLSETKITRSYRNFLEEYKPKKGFIFSKDLLKNKKISNINIGFYPLFTINYLNEKH